MCVCVRERERRERDREDGPASGDQGPYVCTPDTVELIPTLGGVQIRHTEPVEPAMLIFRSGLAGVGIEKETAERETTCYEPSYALRLPGVGIQGSGLSERGSGRARLGR